MVGVQANILTGYRSYEVEAIPFANFIGVLHSWRDYSYINLFHTFKYISVTNATKGYSLFNSLFMTCFGHTWPSSGMCRYAKLLF
jgi:hypothetical protein